MGQKAQERAGILCETQEGRANDHAAGRHPRIIEFARSGVSTREAGDLGRRADIRQTARYNRIVIEAQA